MRCRADWYFQVLIDSADLWAPAVRKVKAYCLIKQTKLAEGADDEVGSGAHMHNELLGAIRELVGELRAARGGDGSSSS